MRYFVPYINSRRYTIIRELESQHWYAQATADCFVDVVFKLTVIR